MLKLKLKLKLMLLSNRLLIVILSLTSFACTAEQLRTGGAIAAGIAGAYVTARKGPLGATPTPTPAPPAPTSAPTLAPQPPPGRACQGPGDCFCYEHDSSYRWCPTPEPPPPPQPTRTPTPPAPAPGPPQTADCLILSAVPASAVPVFTGKPCRVRDGFVPVHDPGTNTIGCIRNWRCSDGDQRYQPVSRISDALRWGGPLGVHRCNDGEAPGPEYICDTGRKAQDGYGRPLTPDAQVICGDDCRATDNGEPWRAAGLCAPVWCEAMPTPAPTSPPSPPPSPPSTSCAVVERQSHWMAPGNKAHGWHPVGDGGGLIQAVIDSTIRSDAGICDLDHPMDWYGKCGQQSHDPDYRKRAEAFDWRFTGIVEDLGPNTDDDDSIHHDWENSAQRVVLAHPDACVTVEVCIPPDARTPGGCLITPQNGSGCGRRGPFRIKDGSSCTP